MKHFVISRGSVIVVFTVVAGAMVWGSGCAFGSRQPGPAVPLPEATSIAVTRPLAEPEEHAAALEPYFVSSEAAVALSENRLQDAYRLFDELAQGTSDIVLTPRARFMAAYLAQLVGQSQRAIAELPGLAEELPVLADTAWERAACAARDLGRWELALDFAGRVSSRSAYKPDMQLLVADSLRILGRCAEAVPAYGPLLIQGSDSRSFEARLRIVQCQETLLQQGLVTPEQAEEALRSAELIIAQAPSSAMASAATEAHGALLAALGRTPPKELKERKASLVAYEKAKALLDDMRNAEAEKALARVVRLARGEGSSLYCSASYDLAMAVQRQRDHARAAAVFEDVAQQCHDTDLRVRALYRSAKAYQSAGRLRDAIRLFGLVEQDYPEHSYADDARLAAARGYLSLGDRAAFAELLSTLPVAYPRGDMRAEALWALSYDNLVRRDWLAARDALVEYHRLFPRETGWYSAGRAPYWLARVEELLGSSEVAMELYEQCVAAAPLSYYALLAYNRLASADPKAAAAWIDKLAPVAQSVAAHLDVRLLEENPALASAVELLRLGLVTRMRRELESLLKTPGHSADLPLAAAVIARQTGSFSDVKRFATTSSGYRIHYPAGQVQDAWRLAYPTAFEDEVDQAASDSSVDRSLVWAVMREESGFDPEIESWANAIGLMQLLLPTAKGVGRRLGLKVNRHSLRQPAVNIAIGAAYLSALSGKFTHPALVIAGYNAGEGAVGRWLKEWKGQDLDLFVESIPYDQTRGYTKRVLSSYATYTFLYGDPSRTIPRFAMVLPR